MLYPRPVSVENLHRPLRPLAIPRGQVADHGLRAVDLQLQQRPADPGSGRSRGSDRRPPRRASAGVRRWRAASAWAYAGASPGRSFGSIGFTMRTSRSAQNSSSSETPGNSLRIRSSTLLELPALLRRRLTSMISKPAVVEDREIARRRQEVQIRERSRRLRGHALERGATEEDVWIGDVEHAMEIVADVGSRGPSPDDRLPPGRSTEQALIQDASTSSALMY